MAKKIVINNEHTLKDLTSISHAAMPLAGKILGKNNLIFVELLSEWNSIAGSQIASFSLPHKLSFAKDKHSDGCLTLAVSSGAFAMEIKQQEVRIIDKINLYFGYPAVSKIKILQSSNPDILSQRKKSIDKLKKNVVSAEQESYIAQVTKDIENDTLRTILENIGRGVLAGNEEQE